MEIHFDPAIVMVPQQKHMDNACPVSAISCPINAQNPVK
jgi:hypothetical protein